MLFSSCVQKNLTVWFINSSRKIRSNYVEYLLSLYKAKFPFNHDGLVLPAVHAWDIPQVVHPM